MSEADRTALLDGERVIGRFDVAGADHGVPGVLAWQADSGATLELIDDAPGFPRAFASDTLTVHGQLRGGKSVTLLDARLTQITNGRPSRLHAATLALGAVTDARQPWPRAIYSTAALSEWRNDTGIQFSRPARRKRPHDFRLDYKEPTADVVVVPTAQLTFTGQMDTSMIGYRPDFWMRNRAVMIVDSVRPRAIGDLLGRHGQPLLSLMSLVADRPEEITREIYLDIPAGRRAEIWRGGRVITETAWRDRNLFGADAILDYPQAIRKWWRLHRSVWPALGLFADHVREGATYSPSRFLMAYSAVEVYGRVARKTKNLKKLRDYAQVDSQLIGCTNKALTRIDITRGYLAHFDNVSDSQRAEVEDQLLESTRRLAALTQACLLRELGFSKLERERLLTYHYRRWPLT